MNSSMSAKNKIILLSIAWLVVAVIMNLFLFKIMNKKNQAALDDMATDRQNLVLLEKESESFKKAQNDLEKMAEQKIQPADFFSKDITLVNEIKVLEDLNNLFGTEVNFSGVSGVVNPGLAGAGTASGLVFVPYSVSLSGSLAGVIKQIETIENLKFITKINGLNLSSTAEGKVNATLSSGFYVKNK